MPQLVPDEQKNEDFRAFLEVCQAWGLAGHERARLVRAATSSVSRWTNEPGRVGLDQDQHARAGIVHSSHELLWQCFDDQASINEFLNGKLPYHPFNYQSMLEFMLKEGEMEDMIAAKRWLQNKIEQPQP